MSFPNIKVTKVGRQLLAEVLNGASVEFSHFVLGDGVCPNPDDWDGLTAPISPVMNCNITKFSRVADKVILQGEFSNANVPKAFLWHELSIYGSIPDNDNYSNVMIFYGNADALAEYVPGPDSTVAVTHRWDTTIALASSASVSAMVQSITYATIEQLSAHTGNTNNPHNVTKDQIGLGNVLDVAPDNMVIHRPFDLTALQTLEEGEPLNVTIMKVGGAIYVLGSHIDNKGNPHKVTAEQAGAAAKEHRSTGTEHGLANSEYFGHVKLSDAYIGRETSGNGIAVTPYALSKAHDELSGLTNQYSGRGTVAKADTSITKTTLINSSFTGDPVCIFIFGESKNVLGHYAILSVKNATISGVSFVDGKATQISGILTGDNFYLRATAEDATPEGQMNANGETYTYSVLF